MPTKTKRSVAPKNLVAAFCKKCIDVANEIGVDVRFIDDASGLDDVFEDDGSLHYRRFGVRAAFNVGFDQSLEPSEQNANTRKVLEALEVKGLKPERVMVDESDGEGCCPTCGRKY